MGGRPSSVGGGKRTALQSLFSPITFIVHNQKSNVGGGGQ